MYFIVYVFCVHEKLIALIYLFNIIEKNRNVGSTVDRKIKI